MIIRSEYLVDEYSWGAKDPRPSSSLQPKTTILTVVFDHGAQRLFSSVRISLGYRNFFFAEETVEQWKITPELPPTVIDRTMPSVRLETDVLAEPNSSSLPVLEITFEVEFNTSAAADDDEMSDSWKCCFPLPSGVLTFNDPRDQPPQKLLDVNQHLTANTHRLSVPFTASPYLYTPSQRDKLDRHPLNSFPVVGRVVHVCPLVLPHSVEPITLPTEVLLVVFQNFSEWSKTYSRWRKDLLSCGLVCKQWTCALDLLLSDLRYPDARTPPDICKLANALSIYPKLALSITHLSPDYFREHPRWAAPLWRVIPSPLRQPMSAAGTCPEQFIDSFLLILQLARNLRSLSLPLVWNTYMSEDLQEALRSLDKVEEVDICGGFNTVHQAYLTMWPSLKRLKFVIESSGTPGGEDEPVPTTPPRYALTEASLSSVVRDKYLNYVLSSSSSSLERLTIHSASYLTNAGLRNALQGVSKSLVELEITLSETSSGLLGIEGQEHALDSLVAQMTRLKDLRISEPT